MMFIVSYMLGCLLEVLVLYTAGTWIRRVPGDGLAHPDPDAPRPWWRNNVVVRRDWFVGLPLMVCLGASIADSWRAGNSGSLAVGMIVLLVNNSILLLCGFYRPLAIGLTTLGALTNAICETPSSPADWRQIGSMAFLLLSIALWVRMLQTIRRRYPIRRRGRAGSMDA